MTPTTLTQLADRLEKATGADRELNALILCALAAPEGSFVVQSPINGEWCIYDGKDRHGRHRLWEAGQGWWRSGGWPLTASIDTALALAERMLPGAYWRLAIDHDAKATRRAGCLLSQNGRQVISEAYSPTPPLAILRALIAALQQQAEAGAS